MESLTHKTLFHPRAPPTILAHTFQIVHNVFLIFLSLGMLLGVLWAAWLRHKEEGVVGGLLCTQRSSERLLDGPLGAVT